MVFSVWPMSTPGPVVYVGAMLLMFADRVAIVQWKDGNAARQLRLQAEKQHALSRSAFSGQRTAG